MTVAGKAWSPIRGKRMRVTRLDASLAPSTGAAAMGISAGFVSVKITPSYASADDIQLKNANGDYAINEKGDPTLDGADAEIVFTGVNPDYLSLITGYPTVLDFQSAATGLRLTGGVPVVGGYALEVWTGVAATATSWGYLLLPALRGGKIGDFTIENGAASFNVTSAAQENPGWGTGPYNVVGVDSSATPGKLLSAIGAKDYVHLDKTVIAPPAAFDGLSVIVP